MKEYKKDIVEKFGIRIRLVKYEKDKKEVWQETELSNIDKEPYWVEQVLLTYGIQPKHDEWGVFGGGPGMGDSAFKTLKEAEEFYGSILKLSDEEMTKKYPNIWYGA
ncbi:unnamed protein product [marine sediment metagenome]|uniref:Uncharacterized protein n=1 Tax=marine sediment metagenome TaxID=412755 RepID=X1AVG1_9ZZZZ